MPHPRPPRLQKHVTRHGNVVWYVRSEHHGPRVRLRAAYGSPEFEAEYLLLAAIGGKSMDGSRCKAQNGSLAWLWDQYRQTGAWTNKLKPSTRRLHENVMRPVLAAAGKEPFTSINRKSVVAGRERRSATPAQARKFLDAMRGLFRWALESGHVKVDPTAGVKNPQKPKNNGFPIWTEEDVEAYHRRWPLGTRQRVWLDVPTVALTAATTQYCEAFAKLEAGEAAGDAGVRGAGRTTRWLRELFGSAGRRSRAARPRRAASRLRAAAGGNLQ